MKLRVPTEAFSRLRMRSLPDLCTQMDASSEVRGFITPNASFETLLQSLINHEHWFDAASLLAHGMPARSSIWWGCQVCTRFLPVEEAPAAEQREVLELCRKWVIEPEDETRMATFRASTGIPNNSAAHWIGMAVFWATGNITPDAGVVTQPPPYLYARGVAAGIDLAANLSGHERGIVYEYALASGMDVACGGSGEIREDD